ncbi:MAG: outer membrane beta-barrel protein [Bacteroidia bacterium]|nr:outer membrane beta-barrel protein [Bacteroidia bacterium]
MKFFHRAYLLFFGLLILCPDANAQGAYLGGGFGFGFFFEPLTDRPVIPYTDSNHKGSLGRGINYGVNVGYMVSENAGLDLAIRYVAGSTFKYEGVDSSGNKLNLNFKGSTLRIMPALKVNLGNRNKFYVKLGPLLGISNDVTAEEIHTVTNTSGAMEYLTENKFQGGSSIGWMGTVGVDFSAKDSISIFIEVNLCRQVYEPGELTVTAAGGSPESFTLVDNPNPHNPNEKQKPSFPFSNIGINAGIRFLIGGTKKTVLLPVELK